MVSLFQSETEKISEKENELKEDLKNTLDNFPLPELPKTLGYVPEKLSLDELLARTQKEVKSVTEIVENITGNTLNTIKGLL